MDKNELLAQVRAAAANQTVSKAEILAAYDAGLPAELQAEKSKRTLKFSEALQYLGGGIVFIGIALLVATHWSELNVAARILIAFGSAILAFIVGILLLQKTQTKKMAYAFMLISILVMPIGVFTIFDGFGVQFSTDTQIMAYEICLIAIYTAAMYAVKLRLYLVPITIFATTLFFTITTIISGPLYGDASLTFNEYRFLITGLSYVLFGYYFTIKPDRVFSSLFYIFGMVGVLGSAIALGGFSPAKSGGQMAWEILFPILAFVAMYFSIVVKQTKILIISALFLMADVIKISGEYFSQSLSWPAIVVIAGLLLIGIGYLSIYLNRRFIKSPV